MRKEWFSTSSLFTRSLDWTFKALLLQDPERINRLDLDAQAMIDVFQGGFGTLPTWSIRRMTHPASTAAVDTALLGKGAAFTPNADDQIISLLMYQILRTGGAGTVTIPLWLENEVTGDDIDVAEYVLAAGEYVTPGGIMDATTGAVTMGPTQRNGQVIMQVPPQHRLMIAFPATGVGETVMVGLYWLALPIGCRPPGM